MSNTTQNMFFGRVENFTEELLNPNPELLFGFKGENESLKEIIARDKAKLVELEITNQQIADIISELFQSTDDVFRNLRVLRWEYIHSLVCPWRDFCTKSFFDLEKTVTEIWLVKPSFTNGDAEAIIGKKDQVISAVNDGRIHIFSDLHPHLITEHHFLEGHETPYRVDPEFMATLIKHP
jgi:hypothetical protein